MGEAAHAEESNMVSEYERTRQQRIQENLQRLKNLGILNLSLQVKALKSTPSSRRRTHCSASPLPPLGPTRRSSRLQNAEPVSYCELKKPKDKSLDFGDNLLRLEGSRPEVYTEEHEKLLGSTEKSWTLFVDGCGKDGKRVYDQVAGKCCHQCRQKTLGHRTHCSKCEMGQGQFCGDCLYMRYGEHVLEAKQNPNWICPVCRGICNCSLCRHAKGWPATGSLYRKITALGYKSVAHYLIQTRRKNTESGDMKAKVLLSAKRSLAFLGTETVSTEIETSESNFNPLELDCNSEDAKCLKSFNDDILEKAPDSVNALPYSKLVSENVTEIVVKPEIAVEAPEELERFPELENSGPKQNVRIGNEKGIESSEEKEVSNCDVTKIIEEAALSKSEISKFSCGPTSVVPPVLDEDKLQDSDEPVVEGVVGKLGLSQKDTPPTGVSSSLEHISYNDEPKDVIEIKHDGKGKTPILKRKHGRDVKPVADSIAGRLRQRRPRIN